MCGKVSAGRLLGFCGNRRRATEAGVRVSRQKVNRGYGAARLTAAVANTKYILGLFRHAASNKPITLLHKGRELI